MIRVTLAVVSLALLATPASAQSRVELFGAYAIPTGTVSGTFTSDYVPVLVYGTVTGGSGGQTLQLQGGRPAGFFGGINWLPVRQAGVQLFVGRESNQFTGVNTPNHIQLTYLSRQPPDYIERTFTYDRSFDWPDTRGDFSLWRVGANGLWRIEGRYADITLGAGLLLSRVRGQFDPASYYEFHLGGHSTLFYEEALARLRFVDTWHTGYNAGIEVAIPTTGHVAMTAGVRLMSVPGDVKVTTEITNADLMIFEISAAAVQDHIGGRPASFSRWGSAVVIVGLRVR